MKIFVAFVFGLAITTLPLSYIAIKSTHKEKSQVLAQNVSATPTLTPTPTPTPTPIATATPTPTPKPSPTPIPAPKFSSQEINGFIDRFSAQYNVDPNVLRHIALCESGFKPEAYNVGYAGLFQFGPITWKNYRVKMGEDKDPALRFNAEEAVQTAAYALSLNHEKIWPNCAP